MKAVDGFRDDLYASVGRLRENVYPELTNADVGRILGAMARTYSWSLDQAAAEAARADWERARAQSEPRPRPMLKGCTV